MFDPRAPKESTGTIDLAKLIGLHRAGPETTLAGMRSLRGDALARSPVPPVFAVGATTLMALFVSGVGLTVGNMRMQHARTLAGSSHAGAEPLRAIANVASPAPLNFEQAAVPSSHSSKPAAQGSAIRPAHHGISPATSRPTKPVVKSGTDKCGYCKGDIQCIITCSSKAKTR